MAQNTQSIQFVSKHILRTECLQELHCHWATEDQTWFWTLSASGEAQDGTDRLTTRVISR